MHMRRAWATGGKPLRSGGVRLRDAPLAYVVGWLEAVVALAGYFCSVALLRHAGRLLQFTATSAAGAVGVTTTTMMRCPAVVMRLADCFGAALALLWLGACHFRCSLRDHADQMGLTKGLPPRTASTTASTATTSTLSIVVFHVLGVLTVGALDTAWIGRSSPVPLLSLNNYRSPDGPMIWPLEVLLLTPLREELLFRATLLLRLRNRAPSAPRVAVAAAAAAVFGLAHLSNLRESVAGASRASHGHSHGQQQQQQGQGAAVFSVAYVWLQVLSGVVVGLALGLRFLRHGRLWECLAVHTANNACASFTHLNALGPTSPLSAAQEGLVLASTAAALVFYARVAALESREDAHQRQQRQQHEEDMEEEEEEEEEEQQQLETKKVA